MAGENRTYRVHMWWHEKTGAGDVLSGYRYEVRNDEGLKIQERSGFLLRWRARRHARRWVRHRALSCTQVILEEDSNW